MADRSFPDQNLRNSLIVVSSADGITPVSLWADPLTHALVTSGGGSGGGGTVNQSSTIDASPAAQNITAQDVGSTTVTTNANNQAVTTGTPTVGSVASFALTGYDSARIQVTGTWTGTLVAQISLDGGNTWYNQGVHESGTAYTQSSFTANFSGHTNAAGGTNWRLQSTTAWTGTATVRVVASVNPSSIYVANNPKIADGTTPSTTATVKAPSTAPIATDTALVVAESPNSPGQKLTDGTNTANVVAGDTGFNGVATASATKTYTFTTSASGAQTILANTPTEGYSYIEIVYTSVGSGLALTGQYSTASGGTYTNSSTFSSSSSGAVTALGASVNTVYFGPIRGNFFQLAVSALTSGTFTGTVTLRAFAPPPTTINASQTGTWTVGSNSATGSAPPANGFYLAGSDGTNLQGLRTGNIGDGNTGSGSLIVDPVVYNGSSFDKQRSATAASNTTGTGLLGVGNLAFDGTNWQTLRTQTGDGGGATGFLSTSLGLYNGSSNDRSRNNTTGVVIAAGATGSNAGVTITTYNASKAVIVVNIASATAATLTVAINGVTSSGYTYPILTSTALATVAVTPLRIFPGSTPTANSVANDMVPRSLQVVTTVTGTIAYGIDYELSV